jgi:hypothetical protein
VTPIQFPLDPDAPLPNPQDFLLKIGRTTFDIGAYCFLRRSAEPRRLGMPRKVALASFLPSRAAQIAGLITMLSAMVVQSGYRPRTIVCTWSSLRRFIDWADQTGHEGCLSGGEATRNAFRGWVDHVEERFRRHEIKAISASLLQRAVLDILERFTADKFISRGLRLVSNRGVSNGTEPASTHDLTQVLAVNQALFDGLSALTLQNMAFPHKVEMPVSLGWIDSHLWCYPDSTWHIPPSQRLEGATVAGANGAFDYVNGEVAAAVDIRSRYKTAYAARRAVERAHAALEAGNSNRHCRMRLSLARLASDAFLFLFLANTGCNLAVAAAIETDGTLETATANQSFRALKFRAGGKFISVITPVSFLPAYRKFVELRKYLLRAESYPYLFFAFRGRTDDELVPGEIRDDVFDRLCRVLRGILPGVKMMGPRAIRASVDDYYRRTHDRAITARVMARSEAVTDRHYLAGSPGDHQDELTTFFEKVSKVARDQKVIASQRRPAGSKVLEEGGSCSSFGHPQALAGDVVVPDCRSGCLFCANRILIANHVDARKVASAAFLMEQLIMGPLSEAELRPKIEKCEEDLRLIAGFPGCEEMVRSVRKDVSENGNLTPYFRDKFDLFLELGVL